MVAPPNSLRENIFARIDGEMIRVDQRMNAGNEYTAMPVPQQCGGSPVSRLGFLDYGTQSASWQVERALVRAAPGGLQ